MLRYLILLLFFVSCSKITSQSNQSPLSPITLLPPNKSTDSYYDKTTFSTQLNGANVVDAWNYIRYNITTNNPGEGVKILILDSGIAPDHDAFRGRISQIQVLEHFENGSDNYNQLTSVESMTQAREIGGSDLTTLINVAEHGTGVASVAGGNSATVGGKTHSGTAWGSQMGVIQLIQKRLDGDIENLDGYNTLISNPNMLSNIISVNQYNVVNLSLGSLGTNYYETNAIKNAITNNNVLLTVATGNNEGSGTTATSYQNPQYPAAFAGTLNGNDKAGMILAVGGNQTTVNNQNAGFNFCGSAKAYCMVAQNVNVMVANPNAINNYGLTNGTSFAAPMVAGAAAVVYGAFPTLTMKEVGTFLLRGATPQYASWETIANADRRQIGGGYVSSISLRTNAKDGLVSDVYGYGALNLLETVKLVQATKVTASYSFAQSVMQASPVIGNSLENVKNIATVKTYDDYGTYTLNLGNNVKNIQTLGVDDKISMSIRGNIANNFASANLGNVGNITFFGIIGQDGSSMTNGKVMSFINQNGMLDAGSSQFNNATFNLSKQFAGVNFSFKDRYNAQNFNLVHNLQNHNPFLETAFNSFNARRFDVEKRFGNVSFSVATMFGNGANLQALNGVNPQESRNFASTFAVDYQKSSNLIGIETGVLRESNTLLGTYSAGALSLGQNNTTIFAKTKGLAKITGKIGIFGSFAIGQTQAGQRFDSIFTNVSSMFSRSFLMGIRFEKIYGGNFELTYAQPLATFSGNATLATANGNVFISLVPTAIEQDFGIAFTKQNASTSVSLQGAYILNKNNIATPPSFGAFFSIRKFIK